MGPPAAAPARAKATGAQRQLSSETYEWCVDIDHKPTFLRLIYRRATALQKPRWQVTCRRHPKCTVTAQIAPGKESQLEQMLRLWTLQAGVATETEHRKKWRKVPNGSDPSACEVAGKGSCFTPAEKNEIMKNVEALSACLLQQSSPIQTRARAP